MAKITLDNLRLAAEWLDTYENAPGETGEAEACQRVAEFLRREAARRANRAAIAGLAKENGFTLAQVRRALAQMGRLPRQQK